MGGTLLTGVMLVKKWKGAILLGILATWALGMAAQALGIYVPDPANGFFVFVLSEYIKKVNA